MKDLENSGPEEDNSTQAINSENSRDMTDQQKAVKILKESEEKYRNLVESSLVGVLKSTIEGTILYVNDAIVRMLEFDSQDELVQLSAIMLYKYPEQRAKLIEILKEHRQVNGFEATILTKNGNERVFMYSLVLHENIINGTLIDLTERVEEEKALKKSQLLLKSSLECQKDTILFSIDREYKYLYFNKAHLDVMKFAYQKDVTIGMNILDCITDEEDRIVAKGNYDRALNGETYSNIRVYGDVNLAYYESFFNPITNENNEIIGATGLARNIDDRIKSEQEIKYQNEELQKLNATKDKFFSIIAHDLRSPFNGFLGLTQTMAEDLPNLTRPEVQKMAHSLSNSAANLYRLLENLLQWSQVQKGAIPFNPQTFHLAGVVEESIEMILESAKIKGIEVTVDIPGEIEVFADNDLLQIIIRNMVSNAVKFTPRGGKVNLSARRVTGSGVEISVRDTGIGMSQEMVDTLFLIDINNKRKGTDGEPSTGLGLILCKEFIEKHGGKIRVESEEGKGTAIDFNLPLHQ